MASWHIRTHQHESGVYRYYVVDPQGEVVESRGGFYSVEEAEKVAYNALRHLKEEVDPPKSAELLAAVLTGRGRWDSLGGGLVQRTVKLWPSISVRVEALVRNSGASRNEMINRVLEVGLDSLDEQLDQGERDRLFSVLGSKEVMERTMEGLVGEDEG
jgi:hypothetical protein